MLKASFNGQEFKNIEGYRITCRLTPGNGFQNNFFVYIEERRQAQTKFEEPVAKISELTSTRTTRVRGTLELSDADMTYQFKDIDLVHVEMGATRRERTRLLEFAYDEDVTDRKSPDSITIEGQRSQGLAPSALGEDYMGGLGESRHLLGFRAYIGAEGGTVVRFSNAGCMTDSFLAKIVALNKEMQSGAAILPKFTVKFAQGDFDVDSNNLEAMFVEESRGSLLAEPTFPVHRILENVGGAAERLRRAEYSGLDLQKHDTERRIKPEDRISGTVETTTLVFKEGAHFAGLSVT